MTTSLRTADRRGGGRLRRLTSRTADGVWSVVELLVGSDAPWRRMRYGTAVTWVLTRALMLVVLLGPERTILNDVRYYAAHIAELGPGTGVSAILREYPTPVLGLLYPPWLTSAGSIDLYVAWFVTLMLALDGLVTWALARRRRGRDAVTLWLAAGPALGPLAYVRFDLVAGVAAGAALLALHRRPAVAGALVTVGAAIKLWPVLLLPAVAAPRPGRVRVLLGALLTGALIGVASLVLGGWDRLLSPLQYQTDRGLQIESVPALPLMLVWSVAHGAWEVTFSRFMTSEISGPGDGLLLAAATLGSALALALMALLWWRAWRRPRPVSAETVGWIMLVSAGLFIVTNKVFSPQYLFWLSPIVVVLVVLAVRGDRGARRWASLLLVVGLLTQVLYPNAYVLITSGSWANPLAVAVLALRDVLLLGLTWDAGRRAWRGTATLRTGG